MNFEEEEEYGAESISRTEGCNSNNQKEFFFKFKDIKGDEQEISGKLNDPFTSLIDKYKKIIELKGNSTIIISINGKVAKPESKTIEDILKEYYPTLTTPYTQDIIDEKVAFHAAIRLRGGKHHN